MASTSHQNSFKAQNDPIVTFRDRSVILERINWDYKNFSTVAGTNKKPFNITFTRRCPDSWLRFRDSCYFIEKTKMEFSDAEISCYEKGATLFVANSLEEFDVVMRSAALNFWSWTGLVQFNAMSQPKWLSYGGVEPARLKWLVSPYTPASNGRTAASECAAYYNSEVKIASYNYFYPCNLQFGSICERNATLINVSLPQ
ncbi:lectin C-type domain protein [Ancylostoma caninum]|uniref:Lectin C-type domain protein n=1 Tax=Ancylostoma caninum TaxID=29170 RepID=A0A368GDE2_ANCCA|nr:lectin C-type domain protein [Ancylostoma caninum]